MSARKINSEIFVDDAVTHCACLACSVYRGSFYTQERMFAARRGIGVVARARIGLATHLRRIHKRKAVVRIKKIETEA